MSKLTQGARNLILVLVAALGICGFVFLLPNALQAAYAEEGGVAALQDESSAKADGSLAVLAFTSDVHNQSNNTAANRTGTWLTKMEDIYGHVDAMAFGGDLGDAGAGSGSNFFRYSSAVINAVDNTGVPGVFATGNHEFNPGDGKVNSDGTTISSSADSTTAGRYLLNTQGREGDNYRIYCLGSEQFTQSYNSSQITALTDYLNGVDNDKPIFIITHFPLHYASNRSTTSASNVIDALNNAVDSGKKIVYIWGHNHTNAPNDTYYDEVFKPGYELQYASGSKKTIKFYYAAAGCMSDSEYTSYGNAGSKFVLGKGLVATVNSKDQLSFTYYTADGVAVQDDHKTSDESEGGPFTEQDPVAIEDVSIDTDGASPTVEVGRRITLKTTVTPADATVKSKTWTSSNDAVATVSSNGTVKGVSPGTATITVTVSDGITRGQVSANVNVEVTERTSEDPDYVIVIDGHALSNVASPNTYSSGSSGWGGGNTYKGMSGVAYTEGSAADASIRWNIVESDDGSGYYIMDLDGNYLNATYTSSGSSWFGSSESVLKVDSTPDVWKISGDLDSWILDGSTLSSTNANNRSLTYEEDSSAQLFTVRSEGDTVELYEAPDPVSIISASITETDPTVEVGKRITLHVTPNPANATVKSVTWASNNTAVATVDANGRVTGVTEGKATITATVSDGLSRNTVTASTEVTVTERTSGDDTRHYVITAGGYALSTERSENTAQGGSSSYTYNGLSGVAYTSGDTAADDISWIFEETEGGYYIKSLDGRYLNATYESGNNTGHGNLKLDDTTDVWVLAEGASLDSGNVDSTLLKSTNATNSTPDKPKYLGYEESPANLFTIRSEQNADEVTINEVEASDPVAVTGVEVSPETATVEASKIVQLTATVLPANATNKGVTWASSDASVATVDENGKVKGVAEGTATITATTADGGKTATCAVTVTPNDNPQQAYVITIGEYAMSVNTSDDQLVNSGSGSQRYYYNGLAGVEYSSGDAATDEISWTLEETSGGYYIKSLDGRYLNATYETNSTGGSSGVLKLDETKDVWVIEGTLEGWKVDGSTLRSTNANKSLTHEETSGGSAINLFTVRSTGEETTLVEASDPVAVTGVTVTPETATVEARKTVQLTATVEPANATNKNVTWTSSDTAIATVDASGKVTGVAAGTATVTATTADGGKTASATVTVTPSTSTTTAYKLVDSLKDGGEYLIVSVNEAGSDNGRALTNPGGSSSGASMGKTTVSVLSGDVDGDGQADLYVETDAADVVWAATANGGGFDLTNGTDYLEGKSGNVRIYSSQQYADRYWTYSGHQLQHVGGTNTYTVYYSNGSFTGSNSSSTNTIYVYEKVDSAGPVAETYTVTFNTNGGSTVSEQAVSAGDKATRPDDPTKVGCYAFGGWYSDEALTAEFSFDAPINADTTVYAKWDDAHTLTATAAKAATCEDAGNSAYWTCSVCSKLFSDAEGKTETTAEAVVIPATGHAYGDPTYTWAEDNKSVTATRTCANDASHVETETVAATGTVTKEPTCEAKGETTYTATFENAAFAAQTKVVDNVPALGHKYVLSGWTWAEDNSTASATFTCQNDETHVETVNGTVTTNTTAEATCETDGKVTYTATATFANEQWTDVKDVTTPALGHKLTKTDAVLATCTEDGTEAYWTCSVCHKLFSDEAGTTVIEAPVTIPATGHTSVTDAAVAPTCTETGLTEGSHCSVCGETIAAQETVPATGHDWGEATYEWSEDNSKVTATRTCKNDPEHVETETADATSVETAPTCTEAGSTTYTAEFENGAFEAQTKTVEGEPATGHKYGTPAYAWAEDLSTCTATAKCAVCDEAVTETVTAASAVTRQPTCTEEGVTTYTAEFENNLFATQTKTAPIDKIAHTPGEAHREDEVPATCSAEGSYNEVVRCTACDEVLSSTPVTIEKLPHTPADAVEENRVEPTCEADGSYDTVVKCSVCGAEISRETTTIPALGHTWDGGKVTTPATCTEPGTKTFTCSVCSGTKTEEIPAIGHAWDEPKYTWVKAEDGDDFAKVIGVMICANDETHVVYEEVEITDDMVKVDPEPTATEEGTKTYTVPFENDAFGTQTREVTLPPVGYVYDKPEYEWERDDSGEWACTATARCLNAEDADIVEKGDVTSAVTSQPSCTAEGETTYTANFKNEMFEEQTKTEPIAMTDHTPADAVNENVVAVGCETDGSYDSVTYCSACGAELGRETVTVPALGHIWTNQTYSWSSDYATATATATCSRDGSHTLEETVATKSVTTAPTCVASGTITYTAAFENDIFSDQTTTVVGDPATGHAWGEATYAWSGDNSTVTASRSCANCDAKEAETVEATRAVTTEPTCEGEGEATWTSAAFENEAFEKQTKTEAIDPLGHDWGEPTYTWSDDLSTCTAERVCARDGSHKETEAAAATSTVAEDGSTVYTAEFENAAFEKQTQTKAPSRTSIATADVTAEDMPMGLFSDPARPEPKVVLVVGGEERELVLDKDFEVVGYEDNLYPGEATVTVRGIGGYVDEASGTFTVDEPFCDVKKTTYHYEDILWMYGQGITKGWGAYPNCEYRPMKDIARADMAAFLYRLAGSPAFTPGASSFKDVKAGSAHYKEIMWLASTGISAGFPDGTFRPNASIVRCDMAAFLYRLAGKPAIPSGASFSDVTAKTDHADEIAWLASAGISTGYDDGTFRPYKNVARCDMAAFLHRMYDKGLVAEW